MIEPDNTKLSISKQRRILDVNRLTFYFKVRPVKAKDRKLLRLKVLEPIYPKPKTSKPYGQHKVHPHLLRDLSIERLKRFWPLDKTYVPMNSMN